MNPRLIAGGAAMAVIAAIAGAEADDLQAGKAYYAESCAICHGGMTNDAVAGGPEAYFQRVMLPPFGPPLKGIYGRAAGTIPDFEYSPGFMRAAKGLVWDDPALDRFLENSREMIDGTIMFFKEPDPRKRRQVIDYLKANS